jgi:bifunctional non-homologous end joining protein LigD
VGYHEGKQLHYAGKVGTGYGATMLGELTSLLRGMTTDTSPFADGPRPRSGVHWTRPELVAQVAFSEWTSDGKLRHPRFLGLREDKRARDVVREG